METLKGCTIGVIAGLLLLAGVFLLASACVPESTLSGWDGIIDPDWIE